MIAGFCLLSVRSRDEAIEWMRRAPFEGGVTVEIRQIFSADDTVFDELSPELRSKLIDENERLDVASAERG